MPYPANFLEERIFHAVIVPVARDVAEHEMDPRKLLWQAITALEETGLDENQAIAALAAKGEGYGTQGELGGLNVYLYETGDDKGKLRVEWTAPGEGMFCTLGMLLAAAETPDIRIPAWYQLEYTMIEDGQGGWVRVCDRIDPNTLVLRHEDGHLVYVPVPATIPTA